MTHGYWDRAFKRQIPRRKRWRLPVLLRSVLLSWRRAVEGGYGDLSVLVCQGGGK
jgi:hypothetical protein